MNLIPFEFKKVNKTKFELSWRGFSSKNWSQLNSMIDRENSYGESSIALKVNPVAQLGSYQSWVYSCVSIISDRLSTLPY